MALFVVKSPALLPDLPTRYSAYAVVKIRKKKGLRKIFGSRAGSVSHTDGPSPLMIQVVPPVWKKGQANEWESLRLCYEQVLCIAARYNCRALSLPLLTAEDPSFPAYTDFKLAVDTIQAFQKAYNMEIYLLVDRQMPQLRRDVERYLSRHISEGYLPWSSQPFADDHHRFDTMAPLPCPPTSAGRMEKEPVYSCPAPKKARGLSIPLPDFSSSRSSKADLSRILQTVDAGFSETLLKLIDKSGKKDSEIYNKANVSRQHFSKIRNNPDYRPTKATAIAFAIALELNMEQTRDLIGRAGYALTNSSKFDVIIMYFIENRNYNMFDINETLYEFDQSLLGS